MTLTGEDISFIEQNIPPPYNTPEKYEDYILPRIQLHDVLCTTTKAAVGSLLEPLKKNHHNRFFCRIDDSHQQKFPAGIIDKIRRSQLNKDKNGKSASETYTIDNFTQKMTDLARFRVVCNFLSDVEKVVNAIETSQKLANVFLIQKTSSITLRPKERKSGERSTKLILEHKERPGLFLEIQVMTQLEEAWDKKDHYLVYEKRRINPDMDNKNFPEFLDAKMFAMSELLYIADQYFEHLRSVEEGGVKNEETDETA